MRCCWTSSDGSAAARRSVTRAQAQVEPQGPRGSLLRFRSSSCRDNACRGEPDCGSPIVATVPMPVPVPVVMAPSPMAVVPAPMMAVAVVPVAVMAPAHLVRRDPPGFFGRCDGVLDVSIACRRRVYGRRRWQQRCRTRLRHMQGCSSGRHAAETQCQFQEVSSFHRGPP